MLSWRVFIVPVSISRSNWNTSECYTNYRRNILVFICFYLFLFVFIGLLGKQNLIFCFLNLCGLPRVGKFPILWFGVPSDEIQVCSLAYAYSLLEMNKENKNIDNIVFLNIFRSSFGCYSTVTLLAKFLG